MAALVPAVRATLGVALLQSAAHTALSPSATVPVKVMLVATPADTDPGAMAMMVVASVGTTHHTCISSHTQP